VARSRAYAACSAATATSSRRSRSSSAGVNRALMSGRHARRYQACSSQESEEWRCAPTGPEAPASCGTASRVAHGREMRFAAPAPVAPAACPSPAATAPVTGRRCSQRAVRECAVYAASVTNTEPAGSVFTSALGARTCGGAGGDAGGGACCFCGAAAAASSRCAPGVSSSSAARPPASACSSITLTFSGSSQIGGCGRRRRGGRKARSACSVADEAVRENLKRP
jgi:hypothetical protein